MNIKLCNIIMSSFSAQLSITARIPHIILIYMYNSAFEFLRTAGEPVLLQS